MDMINIVKIWQKIHEKRQKYTKNAQEKIETTSQFNGIYISMAYIQNGIHSKWHGIAKQFNTAKVGHESNNKVIQNTGDMFNHTFNGMANWSINKLNNTDFKHLIHKSKHAKLHLSKNTRRGENHDATLKIKKHVVKKYMWHSKTSSAGQKVQNLP